MIVVTGGAGFIGSTLINSFADEEIILIDSFSNDAQKAYINHAGGNIRLVDISNCINILDLYKSRITFFYHFGANSSTDQSILQETVNLNIFWSQFFWDFCSLNGIPFIYASSAATYGNGDHGFSDEMSLEDLGRIPMKGLYSWSKMFFDIFAMKQSLINSCPPKWYGLKFFNVYGINELHKGSQSSVIHPFLEQLTNNGTVLLFKSYLDGVNDGDQRRDFISVNYCINFIRELSALNSVSGIYNVGTGQPKTFLNFADDMMKASNISGEVKFIEMPKSLKPHYQYFTKSENIKSKEIHSAINGFDYMEDLGDIIRTLQDE